MATQYDKPFKTWPELVRHARDVRKLGIEDEDTAEKIFRLVPYYDLVNGYKEIFMDHDEFLPGKTTEDLYLFHSFDRSFQNLLFEYSTIIEDYFKNNLAYVLAKDFGVDECDYLDRKNYALNRGSLYIDPLLSSIRHVYMKPNISRVDNPTRHYLTHHNHLPPWILMKNISFSNSADLFWLMKPAQREQVAEAMINAPIPVASKEQILRYSLTLIRRCRNVIAHNLKFISFDARIYANSLNKADLRLWISPELLSDTELSAGIGLYDVYGYLVFALSLIPDSALKILLENHMIRYLYGPDPNGSELAVFWQSLWRQYAGAVKLPIDLVDRLMAHSKSMCV